MIAPKLRGDMAEIMFLAMCAFYGLRVSKPYGDSYPYDFLVEIGTTAWRVQVQGCNEPSNKGRYCVNSCHTGSARPYRKNEVDFIACYLFRTKTWYIIPQSATKGRTAVHLFGPKLHHKGHFSQYFEAWHLLKQPRPCRFCLQASAETNHAGATLDAQNPAHGDRAIESPAVDILTLESIDLQGCTCR